MTSTEYNRAYGIVVLYTVCDMCVYIHIPSSHKVKILLLTTGVYIYSLNHGSTDEYLIIHGGVSQKMHGIKNSSPSLIAIPCFGRHVLTCSQRWAISRYPVENNIAGYLQCFLQDGPPPVIRRVMTPLLGLWGL